MATDQDILAASVLDAAIHYCDTHGWLKGGEGQDGGARCMIGAVESIKLRSNGFERSDINRAVKRIEGDRIESINDHSDTWEACRARFSEIIHKLLGGTG